MTLGHDHFWSVPGDELYDVHNEPTAITIGLLSESWQHLEGLLADEDRAVGYHLVRLADVIRAIGQDTASTSHYDNMWLSASFGISDASQKW